MHIVHISSVHNAYDPRIRSKQIQSVVARGWKATLITGDLQAKSGAGIQAVPIWPGNTRRWLRMLFTAPRATLRAGKEKADIYHLHDPELLPWAFFLRLKGKPVVYDIHEDYLSSVNKKDYLPRLSRPLLSAIASLIERGLATGCSQIIAEKYYCRRFPRAVSILNYPALSLLDCGPSLSPKSKRLLYTGNLDENRGAFQMARLVRARSDFTLVAAGYCPDHVATAMRHQAGPAAACLQLEGQNRYMPFPEIMGYYRAGNWMAGLALFPDSPHYREKELTKFFEYMAVGLPVIASDFPVWRKLIHNQGLGLCVDPENPSSIAEALDWIHDHPDQARAMGQKGKELVAEKYNWEREGQKLLDFYQRIAG